MEKRFTKSVIILANGEFPKSAALHNKLRENTACHAELVSASLSYRIAGQDRNDEALLLFDQKKSQIFSFTFLPFYLFYSFLLHRGNQHQTKILRPSFGG
jgi:hypothetical protein